MTNEKKRRETRVLKTLPFLGRSTPGILQCVEQLGSRREQREPDRCPPRSPLFANMMAHPLPSALLKNYNRTLSLLKMVDGSCTNGGLRGCHPFHTLHGARRQRNPHSGMLTSCWRDVWLVAPNVSVPTLHDPWIPGSQLYRGDGGGSG